MGPRADRAAGVTPYPGRPPTAERGGAESSATGSRKRLRIGLLMDSMTVPIWIQEMLTRVHGSDYARIELIVLNAAAATAPTLFDRIRRQWRRLPSIAADRILWGAYHEIDRRRSDYRDAFRPVDCEPLLAGVPRIEVMPLMKKYSDYIPDADLESIREHDIDVFLRLGFRILRGGILETPRYGVWSYHHGDNRLNRGGPAGFWEVFERWPETGSILQILTEDLDFGRLIFRSVSGTDQASLIRNRSGLYWKTLSFVPRNLRDLHRHGPEKFFERIRRNMRAPVLYSNRLFTEPSRRVVGRLLYRTVRDKLRSMVGGLFSFEQWILLLAPGKEMETAMWRFRKLIPPRDRFWADPHVMARGDRYYVFIEEYLYATGKGRIACLEVDRTGAPGEPYPVLERDYHLSYPFVFEYRDQVYMVPETARQGTIELYRCVEFPGKWEFHSTLMEGVRAYDPTLHYHGGRWWLFCTMVETDGAWSSDELFLFHADSPFAARWEAHPMNPIVSNASCARPAGRLFEIDGRLYRPSQNCAPRYGYGFNLCEVEVLNPEEYSERVVTSAAPGWDRAILATHTFSFAEGLTVGDALLRRPGRAG